MRGRAKIRFVGYTFAFFSSAIPLSALQADLPEDPAALLFQSFASKCSSQGKFTERALSETVALQHILETLQTDDACKGLTPIFNSVVSVSQQLDFLDKELGNSRENYLDSLRVALALSTDPVEQSLLTEELASVHLDAIKEGFSREERKRELRRDAYVYMQSYIDILSAELPKQSLCFQKNQGLPFQFAGHMISLAGAFFGPATQTALSLAGRLIANIFDYIFNQKLIDQIKRYRGTSLQAGVSCALEALEQTITDIDDQRKLIALQQNFRTQSSLPSEWEGYDLYRREYPILQRFLKEVETGVKPQSDAQGERQGAYREKEGKYRATLVRVSGAIGETENRLAALSEEAGEQRIKELKSLVSKLISLYLGDLQYGSSASTTGNIFNDTVPSISGATPGTLLQVYLRTGTFRPSGLGEDGDFSSAYDLFLRKLDKDEQGYPGDAIRDGGLTKLKQNVESFERLAEIRLKLDRSLVLNPDADAILARWTKRTQVKGSPKEATHRLIQYLEKLLKTWEKNPNWFDDPVSSASQIALAQESLSMLTRAYAALNNGALQPLERLDQAFEILQLREQDSIISPKLREVVELDLEKRLRLGLLSAAPSVDVAARLSTLELIDALSPNGIDRLERIKRDLDEAEVLAKFNMVNFFESFGDSTIESLKLLKKQSELLKENEFGINRRKYAKLCILTLNKPELPSNIRKLCEGERYGMDEDGHVFVDFDDHELVIEFDQIASKNPDERFGTYRRLENRKDLFEILQQRPSPFIPNRVLRRKLTPLVPRKPAPADRSHSDWGY